MAHIVEATFEGGAFKPLKDAELKFFEGQRVTLTIEETTKEAASRGRELFPPLSDQEASTILFNAAAQFDRVNKARRLSRLNPELDDKLLLLRRDEELERPKSLKVLEGINETLEYWTQGPKEVRDMIKQQFRNIVKEVRDIQRVEAKPGLQTAIRDGLAYFNNVSSLCIYVILIAAALKVIFLFAGQSTRIVQALENIKFLMTPITLILILLCLLMIGGLHKISRFVKSYQVMSILGGVIAIKVIINTSIVLFTGTSFSAMGAAAWELFAGALK